MSVLIGQSLGRYTILEQLGEGGMATVYKAYDTRLERDVAVKVIRTELFGQAVLERMLKRFEREAKALSKLTHPNIVGVMDYGEQAGRPYLVMEYLPGGTLKQILGQPLPWQEALKLLLPVAEALDFAHSQGIIHRDVKPSNILLTQRRQPMLTDFGIAKLLESEETQTLTGTGVGVGTPEYMAPEQVDARTADQRADIYSLGIVLYEMVTGRKPYQADTPMAVMIMQARDPLPRPGQFVRGLPDGVEKALLKALAKRPEDRYQTMRQLAAALEGLLTGAPVAGRVAPRAQAKPSSIVHGPSSATSTLSTRLDAAPLPPASPSSMVHSSRSAAWLPWAVGGGALVGVLVLGLILAVAMLGGGGTFQPRPTGTPQATDTPQATSTPSLGIGSRWERPADGMTMLYIPAGEFEMGSNSGGGEEKPVHTVYLDAYWMDETEVTNGMYALCVQAGVCTPPRSNASGTHSNYYGNSTYDDYPVIYVNWNQADAYCTWTGARLPTEAEWEKATRGTDGRKYPWGDGGPECGRLNFAGCKGDTTVVGSYPSGKSPYGLYDMAGNVREWVADWYDSGYYASSPSRNPSGPSSGEFRVLRGGSWYDVGNYVRAANRYWLDPFFTYHLVGFRCSRSP